MKMSFYDWCIENNRQDLLDIWDYKLNNKLPNEVSCCTNNEYFFKCPQNKHKSTLWKLITLTRRSKVKSTCKYCNSFAEHFIQQFGYDELDLYWDYVLNKCSPWDIFHGAHTEIFIKCQCNKKHGSYPILPSLFLNKGVRCPYCNGKKVHPDESLAAYYSKIYGDDFLEKYWDYDKNTLNPYEVSPSTNKDYIYIYCQDDKEHGSYRIMPNNFKKNGCSCPICYHERENSTLQISVNNYLCNQYSFDVLHEFDCSIVCKNPQTSKALPYDNEIIINGKHLIIEVNGEQHYNAHCGWNRKEAKRRNITPEQVLIDQQYRDNIKKEYVLSNGYEFLTIPYTSEHDESYKTLIDNKIHEILTLNTQQND